MNITIRLAARAVVLAVLLFASTIGTSAVARTSEPAGCGTVATPAHDLHGMDHGTPAASTPHAGMDHGTSMGGMHEVEFDLMYIDMMIPHHESVIALSHVAVDELTHPELIRIAEAIIETQDAEIVALEDLRDEWYPGAERVSMEAMMGMPGMGTDMELMDQVMSAEWQVQTFCAAEDKDLAFIEQVIPHHQMAIDVSEAALEHAVHPELVALAEVVIDAQEQEIDELERVRAELTGEATPASKD